MFPGIVRLVAGSSPGLLLVLFVFLSGLVSAPGSRAQKPIQAKKDQKYLLKKRRNPGKNRRIPGTIGAESRKKTVNAKALPIHWGPARAGHPTPAGRSPVFRCFVVFFLYSWVPVCLTPTSYY